MLSQITAANPSSADRLNVGYRLSGNSEHEGILAEGGFQHPANGKL
jgi:hypothetical protein